MYYMDLKICDTMRNLVTITWISVGVEVMS